MVNVIVIKNTLCSDSLMLQTTVNHNNCYAFIAPSPQRLIRFAMVDTWIRDNDPSAGSPTETLLRLLLPLNDQV